MLFEFLDLDEETRRFMVEEIDAATLDGNIYFSDRLNSGGGATWVALLREAAQEHTEQWLAYQLEARGLVRGLKASATPSGGYTVKHVPHTAAQTLAEGQFNRYYILGLCRRAAVEKIAEVVVYRAKQFGTPGPGSETFNGIRLRPANLIAQLRPIGSSLGHPLLKPNSGLSVRLA